METLNVTDASSAEGQVASPGAADTAVAGAVSQDANQVAAASSPAGVEGAKSEPTSSLEAVKAALGVAGSEGSPDSGSKTEPDATLDPAKVDGDAAEDDSKLPFHKHPRWQEVTKENAALKARAPELEAKARGFDELQGMMASARLETEEVNTGFNIMAAMKNDPAKAWELLQPYVVQLQKLVGKGDLPPDLAEEVQESRISADRAAELAEHRAAANLAKDREAQARADETNKARASLAKASTDAVDAWEASWKTSDPDYSRKQSRVKSELRALIAERGPPASAEQAVEFATEARKTVDAWLKSILPAAKPNAVLPSGAPATDRQPEPTSMREAVAQGIARARAA